MNANKHQPATRLPWDGLPYKRGDRGLDVIKTDDAFELHAANAYPKLVAALSRLAWERADIDQRQVLEDARALLRELGEL